MTNLSGKRCLIDTNLLVSYINKNHPFHQKTKQIFLQIINGDFQAVLSSQNILELAAVLVHAFKIPKKEVAADIEAIVNSHLFEFIYPTANVLNKFFYLIKKETSLHMVDLFLIATALENQVEVIITTDKKFKELKDISVWLI